MRLWYTAQHCMLMFQDTPDGVTESMPITFQVTPDLIPIPRKFEPLGITESIKDSTGIAVEASGANMTTGLFGPSQQMNGFLRALHTSFDNHLPLTLSPDDVWVAIAQGFSAHVNANAEELRHQFVAHEGQKYIEIQRDFFVKGSPDNDWMGGFAEFSDKIAEYIGKKRDLLVSSFTTTGPVEKAVSEVILMDAMKAYFTYGSHSLRDPLDQPPWNLEGLDPDSRALPKSIRSFPPSKARPIRSFGKASTSGVAVAGALMSRAPSMCSSPTSKHPAARCSPIQQL